MEFMNNQKITKEQRGAIALLSIGTFLEYFDLMLYVHMAVLLNDLFFPQTDPWTAKLLASTAFCLTFILRPAGGYIIGRIGDSVGRKKTIIFTTSMMAIACISMAFMPTYKNAGIAASVGVILCRMLQGFSSLGEGIGASVYLSENFKSPTKYIGGGLIEFSCIMGTFFALAVATFVMYSGFSWRIVFGIGAAVALIGVVARTTLRESPEFLKYKKHSNNIPHIKVKKECIIGLFFYIMVTPIGFYMAYVYLPDVMKTELGMSATDIINHNLKASIAEAVVCLILILVYKFMHPLEITKVSVMMFLLISLMMPYALGNIETIGGEGFIYIFQFALTQIGLNSWLMWYRYFPIYNRFTSSATTFGVSSTLGYVISAFGFPFLTEIFGYYGIWFILIPVLIGYMYAVHIITELEVKNERYYNYPYTDDEVQEYEYRYGYKLGKEYAPYENECEYSKKLISALEEMNKTAKFPVNIMLVKKAITFAKKWHDGQTRKSGEPYYSHPLAVAKLVAQYKFKTSVIVAAILHDVLEDTKCTTELIMSEFTVKIGEMVALLTRKHQENKTTVGESIRRMVEGTNYEAMLIKGLDRLHNLQTIGALAPEKQREIAKETIYDIADAIPYAVDNLNIDDKRKLERKIDELVQKTLENNVMKSLP